MLQSPAFFISLPLQTTHSRLPIGMNQLNIIGEMKKIITLGLTLFACLCMSAQTAKKNVPVRKNQAATAVSQNLSKQIVGLWTISQGDAQTGAKTDLYLRFDASGTFVQSSNTTQGKMHIVFKAPGTWKVQGNTIGVKFKPEQITLDMEGATDAQKNGLDKARSTIRRQFRINQYLSFRDCKIKGNRLTYINTSNKRVTLTRVK